MNLLQLLISTLASNDSVNSVAKKTGLSTKLVYKLIMTALPILIRYMTKNVGSQNGALSLLNALTQHNTTRAMSEQIDDVDEEDGDKIIGHILGDDKDLVVKSLAAETGAKSEEVTKTLGSIAPALLSGLAAATMLAAKNKKKPAAQPLTAAPAAAAVDNTLDLGDLLTMFAGQNAVQQPQTNAMQGLLGSLLGGQTQQQAQPTAAQALMSALLGGQTQQQAQPTAAQSLMGTLLGQQAQPQAQQPAGLNGLLGTLMNASQPVQQQASSFDGSDLLNVLAQLALAQKK
ncbi:MAG: DUF937 domain-containing protein [Solobacterium sp.]|nr:DUF937 domain-containing protein [Solobacterium sp.]